MAGGKPGRPLGGHPRTKGSLWGATRAKGAKMRGENKRKPGQPGKDFPQNIWGKRGARADKNGRGYTAQKRGAKKRRKRGAER